MAHSVLEVYVGCGEGGSLVDCVMSEGVMGVDCRMMWWWLGGLGCLGCLGCLG